MFMARIVEKNKLQKDTKYSDGAIIEKKMLDYAKNKNVSFSHEEEWPLIYHFSKYRENILGWYPFKNNCTILEIGSGCGAITNMLCTKARKVVSVELEYNRAIINYERNKKNGNLVILVDNINDVELENKFDYVILNGVLEYAQKIVGNNDIDGFNALLTKANSFLKKDGTMLLSIENRLGLKYLTGTKEDHLNSIFSGINGYLNSDIKTFSKNELNDLLKKSNCKVAKWYYPYPDYKFPFEIFTDKSINKIYPISQSLPLDYNQIELMNTNGLYKEFMKNNIMQNFANSFLVEIGNTSSNNIDYIKYSNLRNDKFSIYTTIDYVNGFAYKICISSEGLNHIKNISKNNYHNKLFKTIKYDYFDNRAKCELVKGNNLLDEVLKDNSKLIPIIKKIYNSIILEKAKVKKSSKSFKSVFGNVEFDMPLHWIKKINIDLALNNIYVSNDKNDSYIIIDPEWQFDFFIPAEYVVWRILFNLPQNGICDRKEIKKRIRCLGIDSELCDLFKKMELFFQFNYVGLKELPYKKIYKVDINSIFNSNNI